MTNSIKGLIRYRSLLSSLISRDIKVKYRRSVLGVLWSVLNPLLMMAVMTIVFSKIFKFDIPNFPIYYLTGNIIFAFFQEATSLAMASVVSNAPLLKKVYIPKYIFPLQKTIFSFINLIFSFVAILIVLIFQPVTPNLLMILSLVPILYTFVFALGIGMILSAWAVYVRDLFHLYSVLLIAWMYLTPIFYPISILKQYAYLENYNPLYQFINYFRNVFMMGQMPTLQDNLICVGFAAISLILGMIVFKRTQRNFILYL